MSVHAIKRDIMAHSSTLHQISITIYDYPISLSYFGQRLWIKLDLRQNGGPPVEVSLLEV